MGLSGDNDGEDDPYTIQARIGEISTALSGLYELQAKNPRDNYDSRFEALYTERNALKEKLAQIRATTNHTSAEQSRLDKIFTVVDGLKNRPLDWDEQIIRQMVECVKVVSKDKIAIRFRLGVETEAIME
jgi:hypothetical protein